MARGGLAGWIKIGIGADSSEFDSKIKGFKNKMEEADVKAKNLEKDMSDTKEIIGNMTNLLNQLNNGLLTEEQIIEKVNNLSKSGFDISFNGNVQETTEQLKEMTEFYLPGFQAQLQEQQEQYKKINNQAELYKMKIMEAESQHYSLGDATKKSLSSIGNSVEGVIKKFVKWGLAIVGIRSVISLIKRSVSTLSQYDKQLSSNLEYIRWALAQALKPLIEWVVKMIVIAIRLINTLIYKLFGVNLLASATPEKFKEAKDQLSKANDEAKELKKQLAGFDEMNILGDSTDKASKTTESTLTPSFDLSKLFTDKELNDLAKKIKEKIDDILDYAKKKIKEKLNDIWDYIKEKEAPAIVNGLLGAMSIFNADNPEEVVVNAVKLVLKLKEVIYEPISKLLEPIKQVFKDNPVSLGIKGLEFNSKKGEVKGGINSLQNEINKNPLKINKIDVSKITTAFGGLLNEAKKAWDGIKKVFGNVSTFFKNTFSTAWTEVKKIFSTGGKVFSGITDGIVNSFKKIVNTLIDGIEKVITKPFEKINDILNDIRSTKVLGIKPFSFLPKNAISIPKMPRLATGGIINMPGRGVALGGELGPEGVIPMTNKSAMELLGRTIGEYVTINANITNNMNGRLISRVMREVNAQQDFLYNR